jgi:hypothetical protein
MLRFLANISSQVREYQYLEFTGVKVADLKPFPLLMNTILFHQLQSVATTMVSGSVILVKSAGG